jgi:hypothetical protein
VYGIAPGIGLACTPDLGQRRRQLPGVGQEGVDDHRHRDDLVLRLLDLDLVAPAAEHRQCQRHQHGDQGHRDHHLDQREAGRPRAAEMGTTG